MLGPNATTHHNEQSMPGSSAWNQSQGRRRWLHSNACLSNLVEMHDRGGRGSKRHLRRARQGLRKGACSRGAGGRAHWRRSRPGLPGLLHCGWLRSGRRAGRVPGGSGACSTLLDTGGGRTAGAAVAGQGVARNSLRSFSRRVHHPAVASIVEGRSGVREALAATSNRNSAAGGQGARMGANGVGDYVEPLKGALGRPGSARCSSRGLRRCAGSPPSQALPAPLSGSAGVVDRGGRARRAPDPTRAQVRPVHPQKPAPRTPPALPLALQMPRWRWVTGWAAQTGRRGVAGSAAGAGGVVGRGDNERRWGVARAAQHALPRPRRPSLAARRRSL